MATNHRAIFYTSDELIADIQNPFKVGHFKNHILFDKAECPIPFDSYDLLTFEFFSLLKGNSNET